MLQPKQLSQVYYICKELLMTERTYKKDLDIINIVSSLLNSYFTEMCINLILYCQTRAI